MPTGLIGRKVGMTQVFDETGRVVPVTVIQAGPCWVTQVKTQEHDGYNAVQLGFEESRRLNAPERGHTSKAGTPMLRHKKDSIFDTACMFLDQEKRRCTIYESRPTVCRQYPNGPRCGYYDFLKFEREQQGDEEIVAMT